MTNTNLNSTRKHLLNCFRNNDGVLDGVYDHCAFFNGKLNWFFKNQLSGSFEDREDTIFKIAADIVANIDYEHHSSDKRYDAGEVVIFKDDNPKWDNLTHGSGFYLKVANFRSGEPVIALHPNSQEKMDDEPAMYTV